MKRKKVFLFVFLGALVAAAAAIFVVWNKPHATVDNVKGIRITAEALTMAFEKNEQNANASYLNKVIEVNGKIAEVSKNQDNKDVILLETSDPLSGVQCTMRDSGGRYQTGDEVILKGFCNGYTMVVLLSDCVVNK